MEHTSELEKLLSSLPGAFADLLRGQVSPCVLMRSSAQEEKLLAVGTSKLGGRPDLPQGMVWPRGRNDEPLRFLAQIALPELPFRGHLPAKGILYFFYHQDQGQVLYLPDPAVLVRTPPPLEKIEKSFLKKFPLLRPKGDPTEYGSCRLDFYVANSVPLPGSYIWDKLVAKSDLGAKDKSRLEHLLSQWCTQHPMYNPSNCHQVLGHPVYIGEGHLEDGGETYASETDLEDTSPIGSERHLLLQINSDENAGIDWGEGGDDRVFFFIQAQDLHRVDFTDVLVALEYS
jgi:hypothetical protein